MSPEPKTTVLVLFTPPKGNGASVLHKRVIENVPISIAEQIAEDFVRYENTSGLDRYWLYRIEEEEKERLIALDFGEVFRVSSTL